jgi:predicted Zn-dependent protease
MFYNCTATHITTKYADFGNTGWAGFAYICNTDNQCNNSAAYNGTYKSCEARLNAYHIEANPSFYTDAEVQKLTMHELGHCYSLAHSSDPTSVMGNGSVPNAQDIYLINLRY